MNTAHCTAAVYARLSVSTEESVSIARQVEAATRYAEARGWTVTLVATDDGVSATKARPEDRAGWRQVLDSPEPFDAVIVWRLDRLARRVLDFMNADAALQARGAALVAVEDPVDMTTAQGRAFAQILSVFAELEAASIAARVKDARRALVHQGRRPGGKPPLGYRNVPNPEGPGFILAQDPDWIGTVEDMARQVLQGASCYTVRRNLEAAGIEPPGRASRWHDSSVEAIVTSPALAGLTPYRGDVLRDAQGLPIVDESLAVLTTAERRAILDALAAGKRPGSRVRANSEPFLLRGLAKCETCGHFLHRASAGAGEKRYPVMKCGNRACAGRASAAREALEEYVSAEFLVAVGHLPVVQVEEAEDQGADLAEVEAAIRDTTAAMTEDGADVPALVARLESLKAARTAARRAAEASPQVTTWSTGETFREAWEASDLEGRRDLLSAALVEVTVRPAGKRGATGRTFDTSRVAIEWRI